jgi:hypothetical protein
MSSPAPPDKCKPFARRTLKSWKEKEIVNPETNRPIKFYKGVFNKLNKECAVFNDCTQLRGLRNVSGVSCYLDSALFLLLAIPNKHIDKYMLQKELTASNIGKMCSATDDQKNLEAAVAIQDELNRIAFKIRNGPNLSDSSKLECRNLWRILKRHCKNPPSIFHRFYEVEQKSPSDVLKFLFQLFAFDSTWRLSMTSTTSWKRTPADKKFNPAYKSVITTNNISCIWEVPFEIIMQTPRTDLRRLLSQTDTTTLSQENPHYADQDQVTRQNPLFYYKKVTKLDKMPPFLVFDIARVNVLTGRYIQTEINPNQILQDMALYGIIVQRGYGDDDDEDDDEDTDDQQGYGVTDIGGGHYTAYFKCKDVWYEFDDMGAVITCIGSYERLVKNTDVARRGVMYMYTRV